MATVLKTVKGASLSWVQIPAPPPNSCSESPDSLWLLGSAKSAHSGPMLWVVEIRIREPPIGQVFLLRHFLSDAFDRAHFDGESWRSCVAAFLAVPGVPVLGQNFTTQGPATFFHKLFQPKADDPSGPASLWSGLLEQLESLGDQRVTELVMTEETSSWVIFLTEDLNDVVAFGGRPLPQPKYSTEQDDNDIATGKVIRQVIVADNGMRLTNVERFNLDARVELLDHSQQRYLIVFERALRIRFPEPKNEDVRALVEIEGSTGRKWFHFEPVRSQSGRKLTVQASGVSWRIVAGE